MSAFRQLLRRALATAIPRERFLVRGPARPPGVALTFDDGPHAEHTPRLLDLLATHGLHATFFVIGREAERHPALITRMVSEGHAVGHHSWTHGEPAQTSAATLLAEVTRCGDMLASLTGTRSDRFRPPKGQLTAAKVIRLIGARQRIVLWSADPKDYAMHDAAPLVQWAGSAVFAPGEIVLLHDTQAARARRGPGPRPARARGRVALRVPRCVAPSRAGGRMSGRRRVLLVSYHFPPVGGAGVQRAAKFVQYLPQSGWDVSVLQAANPSVPLIDASLLTDLPADLVIVRARTFEPAYAAKRAVGGVAGVPARGFAASLRRSVRSSVPQHLPCSRMPRCSGCRTRCVTGSRLLRRMPHDAILATAPSYTNLVVGAILAKRHGFPLVCDFRDEWDLSSTYWENAPKDRATIGLQRRAAALRAASRSAAIVATTVASTQRLSARAAEAGPAARHVYLQWLGCGRPRARRSWLSPWCREPTTGSVSCMPELSGTSPRSHR